MIFWDAFLLEYFFNPGVRCFNPGVFFFNPDVRYSYPGVHYSYPGVRHFNPKTHQILLQKCKKPAEEPTLLPIPYSFSHINRFNPQIRIRRLSEFDSRQGDQFV